MRSRPSSRTGRHAGTARTRRAASLATAETGHARAIYRADSRALLDHALTTGTPFRERLVWFWANHFTVSIRSGMIASLVGAYVRDAIRPHVTGRFADMLLAVMRHPAMLLYLDNAGSAGPNSPAGQRQQPRPEREPGPRMPRTAHRAAPPPATRRRT